MLRSISRIWALPGARQIRESSSLNRILGFSYGPRWGNFQSRTEATEFLKSSKLTSYNDADVVSINLQHFRKKHLFDWPVICALQQASSKMRLQSLVDFGGHVGAKYYAYRDVISFDPEFKWQIIDVPAVCREGRRNLEQGDKTLSYSEDVMGIDKCDILFCSGSLQYCDEDLGEIIQMMPEKPKMVIINKVAVSEAKFYTLEAFGNRRMPYRVFAQRQIDCTRESVGYKKCADWEIADMGFSVPHQKGRTSVRMIGEIWSDGFELGS